MAVIELSPALAPGRLLLVALALLFCFCLISLSISKTSAGPAWQPLLSQTIFVYLKWRYPIKDTTGTRDLPTCPYEWPNGQGDIGKFLEGIENSSRWETENGRIYRIWSGMKSEVVLTRPEHLRQVFKDSDKHTKALNNNSGWLMSQVLGQCVGLISGEPWRKVRAVTEVPFLHKTVNEYVPLVQRQVRDYVDTLHETGRLQDELLDPAGDMKMLPFFVVAEIIYGHLDQDLVADLRKLAPTRERLFKHVIAGGPSRFPWSQFLPLGANKALRDFKAEWRRFNAKAYQRAVNAQTSSDTAAPIVRMYDAVRRAELSEEQLLQTLDESLYANLDVTTGALSWCIVFLASSAPTCQRLREEIANMRAKDGSQQVSYFLSSSTYLAASIAESSRLKPLAAFSVPQSAPTPRVIDGYLIPAHTDFMIDSYALNIRNDYWGPDRDVYRPERWFELKTTDLRYHFWRFGFGPRQCMGKYVADLILKCLMVHLLEEYELSIQKSEEKWQRDPESWITHPKMLLNCERRTR